MRNCSLLFSKKLKNEEILLVCALIGLKIPDRVDQALSGDTLPMDRAGLPLHADLLELRH